MESLDDVKRVVQEMKHSLEVAHSDNGDIKNQVSGFEDELKFVKQRLSSLEMEMRSMRGYVSELENYCVSLDSALRKHHLIISGVTETKGESLSLIAYRILSICCISLELTDLDYSYRIGAPPHSQKKGGPRHRPILVKLVREDHRRQIYQNKLALKQTQEYNSVYLNEDLPKIIAQKRADIRSVYLNAKKKGHVTKMIGSKISVDNITYQHQDLEILPSGLRLSDSKVIKVKGGYAFASENAYLSNFSKCSFVFDGINYDSAERAYQAERARRLKAPDLAQQIYDCRRPNDCKRLSYYANSTPEWDQQKREVMKSIVLAKFRQNSHHRELLLATGTKRLIEATTDSYWGAAALLGSKLLSNGKWSGQNVLGTVLEEIREELQREYRWVQMQAESSDDASVSTSDVSTHDEIEIPDPSMPPSSQQTPPSADNSSDARRPSELGAVALNQSVTTRKSKNKNRKKNRGGGFIDDTPPPPGSGTGQTSVNAHMRGNHPHLSQHGDIRPDQNSYRSPHDPALQREPTPVYPTPPLQPIPSAGTQHSSAVPPPWYWPPYAHIGPPPHLSHLSNQPGLGSFSSSGMCLPPTWNSLANIPFNQPPPSFPPPVGSSANYISNSRNSGNSSTSNAGRKSVPRGKPPAKGQRKVNKKNSMSSTKTDSDLTICIGSQTM